MLMQIAISDPLIAFHLKARGGRLASLSVLEEMLVCLAVVLGHLNDLGTDQETLRREMNTDLLVPAADQLHSDLSVREVDLGIKPTILPDKVVLPNADRLNNESNTCTADIVCLAADVHTILLSTEPAGREYRFKSDLDREVVLTPERMRRLGEQSCYLFGNCSQHFLFSFASFERDQLERFKSSATGVFGQPRRPPKLSRYSRSGFPLLSRPVTFDNPPEDGSSKYEFLPVFP